MRIAVVGASVDFSLALAFFAALMAPSVGMAPIARRASFTPGSGSLVALAAPAGEHGHR